MKKLLLAVAFTAMLASLAAAQVPDPRVADLVQAGKIRVGVHSIMYTKDPRTGELKAASTGIILLDIARTLGARIGVEVLPVGHPTIPEMLTCLAVGACDMGFMGPDRSRGGVDFSPPLLQLDYTFLVPAGSSIQRVADADRPAIRIAVVRDHASTLTLSRIFKHAQLVYAATPEPTFELLRTGQADAFASIRAVLLATPQSFPARGSWRITTGPTSSAWWCRRVKLGGLLTSASLLNRPRPRDWCSRPSSAPACPATKWHRRRGLLDRFRLGPTKLTVSKCFGSCPTA